MSNKANEIIGRQQKNTFLKGKIKLSQAREKRLQLWKQMENMSSCGERLHQKKNTKKIDVRT